MENEILHLLISADPENKYLGYCLYMTGLGFSPEDLTGQIEKYGWTIGEETRKALCAGRKSNDQQLKDVADFI